ncbi:2-oxo acid dehydrogenase subunit E2 [Deltaproteobacteria bacterium TL4]
MSIEIKLPDLGDGIEGGDVISIMVSVGNNIAKNDPILELETDKATLEVPAPESGVVEEIKVKLGDNLKVGQVLLLLTPVVILGEIAEKHAETETVSANLFKAEIPYEKAKNLSVSEPSTSRPSSDSPVPADQTVSPSARINASSASPKKLVPAAPSVRRFAREIGVEIAEVPGSGASGRISMEDVKKYSKKTRFSGTTGTLGLSSTGPLPNFNIFGKTERLGMNKIRQITAQGLSASWNTIPHVTQFDKADITHLENLRKINKDAVEEQGGKLTITGIIVKILAMALKKFPNFNVSLDLENKQLIQKYYYHIGVAVDTPQGLVVPVIRDVDKKNILQISRELTEISQKARSRKVTPTDLQGSCITLSNLGGIAGTGFTPIVNWPDVAILGVSKSEIEPVYQNGELKPALRMPLSLSYDHRVIDGVAGAKFLQYIVNVLENPFLISLEG